MLYIPKKEEIPIVAPTPTPFTKNDKPDYLSIEKNINKWNETSLDGFVLGSYGGEEFHLSEDEKIEIIKVVSATMSNKKFIIAGIDTASPTIALKLSEKYAHAGANMIRVRIPKIDKDKSNENVVDYFKTITDNSSIPVIVIHQPAISMDINLSPSELSEITHLDNIYSYIMSSNFRWESIIQSYINAKVQLWACNGSLLLPSSMIGADGACLFFANWAPDLCRKIIKNVKDKKFEEAQKIQKSIIDADFIGSSKGVAALKKGLNLLGYSTTKPRRPTRELDLKETEELKESFIKAGLI
jgi:4-hydroxy-2-oxoglutarate aldolase